MLQKLDCEWGEDVEDKLVQKIKMIVVKSKI